VLKFLPKTYQNNHLESLLLGIWMCLVLLLPLPSSAQSSTVSSRAAYYDQIEERARSLSDKLATFTNSETNNENAFLNSDVDFNSSFVKIADENESISFSDALNPTSAEIETEATLEDDVEPITMESHVGKYYIQPFIGFSIPPHHINFKGLGYLIQQRSRRKLVMLWGSISVADGEILRQNYITVILTLNLRKLFFHSLTHLQGMLVVSLNYLMVGRDWDMACHSVKEDGSVLLLELDLPTERIFLT